MVKLLGTCLRALAALMRLLPQKRQVVLMSRQSAQLSLDFHLLAEELQHRLGPDAVKVCIGEPELGSIASFIKLTIRQLHAASISKVVVLDGYSPAVCIPAPRPRRTVFQTWHALGAIKRFGWQSIDTPAGRSRPYAQAACMHRNYDRIIAPGPGAVDAYCEAFGYTSEHVDVLGLPRIDYLLDPNPDSTRRKHGAKLAAERPFLNDGLPIVLYAPTLRKNMPNNWQDIYLCQLASHIPAGTAHLVFAGHPLENNPNAEKLNDAVHFIPEAPTIDLLESADCVITDYSSIAFEAGLLGKNVCFYVPDIDEYTDSPGLNIELSTGDIALASDDAEHIINAALHPHATEHRIGFDAWRTYCNAYLKGVDYGSTSRIADAIEAALSRD